MATPNWLGATAGQAPQAGQVNQFLGTHAVTYLYAGTLQDSQVTAGGTTVSAATTYLAQKVTTGAAQTKLGYAAVVLTGGGAGTQTTLSLYASSGGAPTGSPLVTTPVSSEHISFSPTFVVVPLPVTVTAATTYFLVLAASGGAAFTWHQSNQVTGAYTSANGTTWAAQSYGFEYQIFDQAASGSLTCTWEDAGARWSWLGYSGTLINKLSEYTTSQNGSYLQSTRTFSYSGGLLAGVS